MTGRLWMGAAALMFVAGTAQAQNVGGTYSVDGTNLDGSRYGGTARIDITGTTTCRMSWDAGSQSDGICMRNGNTLAAAYAFESGEIGLIVYAIKSDGTLDGIWTIADTDGAGTEVLTPAR